jgi:CHASE2 domain-containing sensor protein
VPRCIVLIAAAATLPALKTRAATDGDDLLAFNDTDALRALEAITKRRPAVVALERLFAATPRGAALINRIKADPSLIATEIRVVSHDTDQTTAELPEPPAAAPARATVSVPIDEDGTRQAPRYAIAEGMEIVIDRHPVTLIDLSVGGAQVISANVLKPNQRVRVTLTDEQATLRVSASIAWATFEIFPKSGPRYRAGLQFLDGDAAAIDAFALRHLAT